MGPSAISPIFLTIVDDPELAEKMKRIYLQSETERTEAETERLASSEANTLLAQMMGAVCLASQ